MATFGFSTDTEPLLTDTTVEPYEDGSERRVFCTSADYYRSGQDNSMLMSMYGVKTSRARRTIMREVKT